MKPIKQITLYAFIFSALAFFYIHQDLELNNFNSFSREYDTTQQDNNEDDVSMNFSNMYANNGSIDDIENNHTETSTTTDDKNYSKIDITTKSYLSNSTDNKKPIINQIAYHENTVAHEHGPNNNYQDEPSTNIQDKNSSTLNKADELTTTSDNGLVNEVDEINNIITLSTPPPPGGDAQDPMSVPIDNFYGLAFLLITAIIFGVFNIKKMRVG